jgi:hypothetical protein
MPRYNGDIARRTIMSRTLTLEIPEKVYRPLKRRARAEGRTMEEVAADCIAASIVPDEDDPLLKLAGVVTADVSDAAERHDDYITDHLIKELDAECR